MSFGTLALIGICGLAGPLLSAAGQGLVPAVVGEIVAGVIVGRTGLQLLDTANTTLSFLSDVGFAMLMFSVGMNVPLGEKGVLASLDRGTLAAGVGDRTINAARRSITHRRRFHVLAAVISQRIVLLCGVL
jgi:Kef-type K+ transport system membrane component KefB